MPLTVDRIAQHIRQTLRGMPAGFSVAEIVNAAGEALANAHPWGWLVRGPQDLSIEAGASYVVLPPGREILALQVHDSGGLGYQTFVGHHALLALRQTFVGTSWGFAIKVAYREVDGALVRVLEIEPPVTEDEDSIFVVWMAGNWPEVTDDDTEIKIPEWMNGVMIEFCRACALSWQYPERGSFLDAVGVLTASQGFQDAQATDGELLQPSPNISAGGAFPPGAGILFGGKRTIGGSF